MSTQTASNVDLYVDADFCLFPIGTRDSSIAEYIAEVERILKKSGVHHKMHGYGTNIEGPWSEVSKAIHDCHAAVHAMGAPRIATDIRLGTRLDKKVQPGTANQEKVRRVEEILAKEA